MADATPGGQVPSAYNNTGGTLPDWLNKGDNAWQMTAATLVGMQSVPGLVILYGSIVKKKWAVNSAFMAFYAFAAVLICWVIWAYKMSFGEKLIPIWGKAGTVWGYKTMQAQAMLPATQTVDVAMATPFYPLATMIYFQFVFAAICLILLAGSLLGRMNFIAWMLFVPLWLTFSYTIGAFALWGGGCLFQWGVIDYSGGYVIHLSAGVGGFTAAYWVHPIPFETRKLSQQQLDLLVNLFSLQHCSNFVLRLLLLLLLLGCCCYGRLGLG
jgi:Amt family ammonium transporter